MDPVLELLGGWTDPEAAALFSVIGGVCGSTCGTQFSHGYAELAQGLAGQRADTCRQDLHTTFGCMLDTMTYNGDSFFGLDHPAISASLAATLDGVELQRGFSSPEFHYHESSNSLSAVGVGRMWCSRLVVSYKHWTRNGLAWP